MVRVELLLTLAHHADRQLVERNLPIHVSAAVKERMATFVAAVSDAICRSGSTAKCQARAAPSRAARECLPDVVYNIVEAAVRRASA